MNRGIMMAKFGDIPITLSKHDDMGSFGVRGFFWGFPSAMSIGVPIFDGWIPVKIYFLEGIAVYRIPLQYPRNINTLTIFND